jgi:hypothetical protein
MKVEFTHYWVTGFGWEVTIFLQSDFDEVEELGYSEKDGFVFLGIKDTSKHILKGNYIK